MTETSSLGSGRPRSGTIDVSVNLLTEWFEARARARRTVAQLQWTLLLVATAAVMTLPWLLEWRESEALRASRVEERLAASKSRLAALLADEKRVQPMLDAAAMSETARLRAEAFVGELIRLCNSAPNGVYFSSIRCDVNGGEATIRCQGEAETEEALNRFLAVSREAPGTTASRLLAARPSTTVAPDGSAFEYQKRAEVSQ